MILKKSTNIGIELFHIFKNNFWNFLSNNFIFFIKKLFSNIWQHFMLLSPRNLNLRKFEPFFIGFFFLVNM